MAEVFVLDWRRDPYGWRCFDEMKTKHNGDCNIYGAYTQVCTCGFFDDLSFYDMDKLFKEHDEDYGKHVKSLGIIENMRIEEEYHESLMKSTEEYLKESEVKIQDREVNIEENYLDPVTYVPSHAEGNAGHPDCEQGVIISVEGKHIRVLYCHGRTVQSTKPENLVWG